VGEEFICRVFHAASIGYSVIKLRKPSIGLGGIIAGDRFNSLSVEGLIRLVDVRLVERMSRRFGDFDRLYNEYREEHGGHIAHSLSSAWLHCHSW